jgi:hypothetical protein
LIPGSELLHPQISVERLHFRVAELISFDPVRGTGRGDDHALGETLDDLGLKVPGNLPALLHGIDLGEQGVNLLQTFRRKRKSSLKSFRGPVHEFT